MGLSESELTHLSDVISKRMALRFIPSRWGMLERNVGQAASQFGFGSIPGFTRWLASASLTTNQMEILSGLLTTAETYFWREPRIFEALENHILPQLVAEKQSKEQHIRIWSAGSSSGEEPYSIAMALRRTLPSLKKWKVTILATDINPGILRKAAKGIYGNWSFRNTPSWLQTNYFTSLPDGKFEISPLIRDMVTFAYHNLAEDPFPSMMNNTQAMDLIFCRNVLMYFSKETAIRIGNQFFHSLTGTGSLIVSATELSQQLFPAYTNRNFKGATIYVKKSFSKKPESLPEVKQPLETNAPNALLPSHVPTIKHPLEVPLSNGAFLSEGANEASVRRLTDEETIRSLANQGKLSEAVMACNTALQANKLDPLLYYLHATILQELHREDEAIRSFNKALYIDPDFILAHFSLATMLSRAGKIQPAKKHYRNVLALLEKSVEGETIPYSEGLSFGRFQEIMKATQQTEQII